MKDQSLILVRVGLKQSNTSVSGYLWTSTKGFPGKIFAGNLCQAKIITKRQAPITLILPTLKVIVGVSH